VLFLCGKIRYVSLDSVAQENLLFNQDAVSEDCSTGTGPERVDVSDREYWYEAQDFRRSRKALNDSCRPKPVQDHILQIFHATIPD